MRLSYNKVLKYLFGLFCVIICIAFLQEGRVYLINTDDYYLYRVLVRVIGRASAVA